MTSPLLLLCRGQALGLAAGISLLLLSLPAFAQGGSVRIAVGEWPPYFSETADGYGTYAKVVTRAFEMEGISVEYGFFPWGRALVETKEGRWPVSAGWGITPDREPFFHFCDPVLTEREQFYFSTDRPVVARDWNDFTGLSVGALQGAALGEDMDRLVADGKVTIFRQGTLGGLLKMLRVGRVDLVMGNEFAAADAISTTFPPSETGKYIALEDVSVQWDYRVIVSKNMVEGEELCSRFNRALKALRHSGEFERLMHASPGVLQATENGAS